MPTILQIQNLDILEFKQLLRDVISEEILKICKILERNVDEKIFDTPDQLLSMKEAAQYLRVTTVSLYKYIKDGDIKNYRVGKRRKFKKADLENYLRNSKIQHRYSKPIY